MRPSRMMLGASLVTLAFAASAQTTSRKLYIVQLKDAPVASYTGGVTGLRATQPAPGARLNVSSADVQAYTAYLAQKQATVTATLPASAVGYKYRTLLNGFSAQLTDAEFAKLVADPAVKAVTVDTPVPVTTSSTPSFLGLKNIPEGVWNRTDASGRIIKGEGVIIGHIDGGVWPENTSFSDKVDAQGKPTMPNAAGTLVYNPLPAGRWKGGCQPGMGFNASHCNNKLIGAKYFNTTQKLAISLGIRTLWSGDYLDSPRDADGHGTHTLSTAGGNENSTAVIAGSPFSVSGIAPRARVAAYKSCYVPADANDNPLQGSCYQGDSIAAAEAAVADGVDVINFSVGGSTTAYNDAVETAFLNAALAGVFVSASSGNSNTFPGNAATAAHLAPWLMTVGNSTHDRLTAATVTLGDGTQMSGTSFQTTGLSSRPLIWSRQAGFDGVPVSSNQALCFGGTDGVAALLDPVKVAGKILVCERGSNALVNKVANGKTAGAVGVIILNTPTSLNSAPTISAALPTVHLTVNHYPVLTAYLGTPSPTASFGAAVPQAGVIAPVMSDSSSRGPNPADTNMLKPDITAPGTDIIAAYTNEDITPAQRLQIIAGTLVPEGMGGMISGTSMSSPHIAGAAALLRQANPTWSPFAIKSALMTSALQTVKLANGSPDPSPWGYGAGHLNPNLALDTKVVYDQTNNDHINYYLGAINGRTLNVASLTHANVVGVGSLVRRLTNKGSSPVTYTASASLPGYTVVVTPSMLTIPAGGTAQFTVTMTRTSAPIEEWRFGHLTWTGSGATLRSPLSAKASQFVGLSQVTDTRATGTKVFTVAFGYDGPLFTTPIGLQPGSEVSTRISTNQRLCLNLGPTAAGTKTIRGQLFNSDTEGGAASDLDLVLQRLQGTTWTTVLSSGAADSNELVSLANPVAGASYRICIDGYAPINGNAGFKLTAWVLGPTNPGTLKAFGPSTVKTGGIASIGLNWSVPTAKRYLGLVEFRSIAGGATIGSTEVFIDTIAGGSATQSGAAVTRLKDAALD